MEDGNWDMVAHRPHSSLTPLGPRTPPLAVRMTRCVRRAPASTRSPAVRVRALAGVDTTPLVQAVTDTLSLSSSQQSALATFLDTPEQVALAAGAFVYLCLARPGALSGYVDYFIFSTLQKITARRFKVDDFEVQGQLGKGNFGSVFQAILVGNGTLESMSESQVKRSRVVVKKVNADTEGVRTDFLKRGTMARGAAETGIAENYLNALMARAAPGACASFLGSFFADKTQGLFKRGELFLVWKYESDATLEDFVENRIGTFPGNLHEVFLSESVVQRKDEDELTYLSVQKIMRSVCGSLAKMHYNGIIHRDVKPSNVLITAGGGVKFIDLGAATDLRVGINFNPLTGMLDPEYAPPEQLVVPESTPRAPPPPIAIALSPLFFAVTAPALFDSYSVGVLMLQLLVPELRTFQGLRAFKRELESSNWDLQSWRDSTYPIAKKADFTLVDMKGGGAWDLATKLVTLRLPVTNRGRLSVDEALRHRYFTGLPF